MLTTSAQGVYAIAPTPFHEDGRVDEPSTDRMVDFYREVGCTGITVLGIMGEAPKLDHAEALAVASRVIRRAGIPVVVGVSAPGFAAMRSLARAVMDAGAAGVMIAPPPSLRTDDQIVGYFAQAAEAVGTDVPFVLQDYPLTLGVIMTPAAPASMAERASARMAAKPGALTPTTTGRPARRITRAATSSASPASSFGASPMMPSTVMPVQPTSR